MDAERTDAQRENARPTTPQNLDTAHFREKLEQEQARLLRLNRRDSHGRPLGRNPDRTDLAQAYANRERNLTLSVLEEEQLQQVEAALQRLEDGTYGRCERCGQPINPERLEALPYATLCINCRRLQEQA